jgi:uncharacterized protein (TIGR03067 family)
MAAVLLTLLLTAGGQPPAAPNPLQGAWKITALVEDGKSLTEKDVSLGYAADGQLRIDGNVVSLVVPGSLARKTLIFTTGEEDGHKTIDLAGTTKAGAKGIYSLAGNTLLLCLGPTRPASFSAEAGTDHVLIALRRDDPPAKPADPPAPPPAADVRAKLIGTWGHQTDSAILYYTLNADGTFSTVQQWKRGFKKMFNDEVRSSGTWKFEGDTIIATVTQSSERERRGHVFSFKVTRVGPDELITVNQNGEARREWRVR